MMAGGTGVHVFVGPSISADLVGTALPNAIIRPPAAQGDILRALYDRPTAIAVIDGYFDLVPAVWHKEIMVALASGVAVYGASSIGALRAAELQPFGMIGHGRIFECYRDGILEDDDEVAVVHASPEDGYRQLSHALVDLRDLYERAEDTRVITPEVRRRLVDAAKQLPYPERHHRRVLECVDPVGIPVAQLDAFVRDAGPGLKARDALSLLALLAETPPDGVDARPSPLRVEPTVFLQRLYNEVQLERASGISPLPDDTVALRGLDSHAVLRKKVLTRLLGRELAGLLQIPVSDEDLADAMARFRISFDLADDQAWAAWREVEGISDDAMLTFLQDWVLLDKLQRQRTDDIDLLVADQLRIATARLRVDANELDPGI